MLLFLSSLPHPNLFLGLEGKELQLYLIWTLPCVPLTLQITRRVLDSFNMCVCLWVCDIISRGFAVSICKLCALDSACLPGSFSLLVLVLVSSCRALLCLGRHIQPPASKSHISQWPAVSQLPRLWRQTVRLSQAEANTLRICARSAGLAFQGAFGAPSGHTLTNLKSFQISL